MKIVGIDPGLRNTAYACIENEMVRVGDLKTKTKQPVGESLAHLHSMILRQVFYQFQPDLIAIEGVFYTPRVGSSYLNTAAVIGIIEMIAYQRNVKTVQYSPPSIKKFICGNGRANKDDVKQAVIQRYAHAPDIVKSIKSHHHADAVAIDHTLEYWLEWHCTHKMSQNSKEISIFI